MGLRHFMRAAEELQKMETEAEEKAKAVATPVEDDPEVFLEEQPKPKKKKVTKKKKVEPVEEPEEPEEDDPVEEPEESEEE